ncbi:hybrid sensor histidine kinase/response regulator [Massilia sp. KIM]|uniref:hybrid sensor histidine kinase/response regulator n=1 Tax=Massilia sp. KIM TaxID=1955422 RepID=UPI00098FA481|nr:ATP-binding protein [Massilia sp. KIM]OON62393.1 hybrid sensor histidine kinase/response regulator [Massilia sp. KIM]
MRTPDGLVLSLRHLLIVLTAIGLLPLALLGAWAIHGAARNQAQEQERLMLNHARALSSAVDAELDATVNALGALARTPEFLAGDLRAFHRVAGAQLQPSWLGVIVSDESGKPLLRTMAPYDAPPAPVADPDSLRRLFADKRPVVGRVTRGVSGRPAVPVRIAVQGPGEQIYALSAVVRPDRFLGLIARQKVPSDSVISVMDASYRIVARSRDQDSMVAKPGSPSLLSLMQRGGPESVGHTRTLEGADVVTAYTTSSRYGWSVAIGSPNDAHGYAFTERIAYYAAGFLATLAVCIGLALWLSRRIVAGIGAVQAATAALGEGEAVRLPRSRIRELRLMAGALEAAARRRVQHEQERSQLLANLGQALARQEEALAEARQAGQAKDQFLAMLGHELRNPLSPILAALDMLDLRREPAAQRERAIMRRQVDHLRRLVDDLLDVSRITSGKLRIEIRPLDLAEVARQTVAARAGEAIVLQAPDALWVEGDETRLAQVLNNLLSNAARFGSSDTRVRLDAIDGQARVVVSDNGVGMTPALLAQVFEPFFQAPQPLARRTGGLGLGLAIVRKIVELHGGTVTAHSDGPEQGSRFELRLPLGQARLPDAPGAAAAPVVRRRILLVDDNEDAAALAAALLADLGHEVRVAHTAGEALAVAPACAPEVAILDIGLPDMDGYALAAALRARQGGAGLRLVALTGYGQKEDVERALDAGFDVHLTKPATLEALRQALAPQPATAA